MKGVQRPRAASSAAAAGANDAKELDRLGHAFEFARTTLLGDEEPGHLTLNVHGDEHRARIGRGLNARGDVRRVAEHLAAGFHDDRPGLNADAR